MISNLPVKIGYVMASPHKFLLLISSLLNSTHTGRSLLFVFCVVGWLPTESHWRTTGIFMAAILPGIFRWMCRNCEQHLRFQGQILDKGKLLEPVSVWDIEPSVSMRFNLDGFVRATRADNKAAATIGYTQVFRNGVIETVDMSILGVHAQNVAQLGSSLEPKSFNGERYERKLLAAVKRYLDLLKFLGVEPPLFIMLSFLGVKGYKISLQKTVHHITDYTGEIDRNNLIIPEIMFENFAADLAQAMKPIFDTVWNAAGNIGSPNYNAEGKFTFGY